MAATEAARRTRRTNRIERRGAHAPAQVRTETSASEARPVTPAFHITPNVVLAARGTVRPARERRSTRTSLRSLRRFAA